MKKIYILSSITSILLIVVIISFKYINHLYVEHHASIWYERMANNLSPAELAAKYPEITYYKLDKPPYTQWCYIAKRDLFFTPPLAHDMVFCKDEKGHLIAYWKGPGKPGPMTRYRGAIALSESLALHKDGLPAHETLRSFLINAGFEPYFSEQKETKCN